MTVAMWDHSLRELFLKGGPVMWPILACSVAALAIVLDRAVLFVRMRMDYRRFLSGVEASLRAGAIQDAAARCRRSPNPVARVAGAYLDGIEAEDAVRARRIEREGSMALEAAERRIRGLAAIAQLATLLGLLGTVMGLVSAFQRIETAGGQVQPGDLAAGIWAALLTTVFGLAIAIPCMGAYHVFDGKADRMARWMELAVAGLDEWFGRTTPGVGSQAGEPDRARESTGEAA